MDAVAFFAYRYEPLAHHDSIRLLTLQPGLPGTNIFCDIEHTTLSECDDIYLAYTALSYVWGDPADSRTLFVQGCPITVTANLLAALDDLRDERQPLRLWVDAICIDQSNTPERNAQVSLMQKIYSFAKQTVIHLGRGDEELEQFFTRLPTEQVVCDRDMNPLLGRRILSCPWFTRVWTYQELVLSKEALVQYGRSRMKWQIFCQAFVEADFGRTEYTKYNRVESGSPTLMPDLQILSHMWNGRQQFQLALLSRETPPSLLSVLLSRRGFKASDLRDLVYGNLGVAGVNAGGKRSSFLVVDYKQSVDEVFENATAFALARNPEVLLHVETWTPTKRRAGLPSWVPDWSLPSSEHVPSLGPLLHRIAIDREESFAQFRHLLPSTLVYRAEEIGVLEDRSITLPRNLEVHDRLGIMSNLRSLATEMIPQPITGPRDFRQRAQIEESFKKDYRALCHFFQRLLGGEMFLPRFPEDPAHIRYLMGLAMRESDRNRSSFFDLFVESVLQKNRHNILGGRKVARLPNDLWAIVPGSAFRGDIIHKLCNGRGPIRYMVVRECSLASTRIHQDIECVLQNQRGCAYHMNLDAPHTKPRYFKLIGEAWVKRESMIGSLKGQIWPTPYTAVLV